MGGRDDRGESLLELLVAVTIMGIAVVAVVGGIGTGILMSDIHRKQATAGAYVRDYAEAVEKAVAASPSGYVANCAPNYAASFTPPGGYTAQITAVSFWNGSSFPTTCDASADVGVQQVSLRVQSGDGRAAETLSVVIRRPCRSTDTSCA
jgi:type II secretory pathway pseudopilin PulG